MWPGIINRAIGKSFHSELRLNSQMVKQDNLHCDLLTLKRHNVHFTGQTLIDIFIIRALACHIQNVRL